MFLSFRFRIYSHFCFQQSEWIYSNTHQAWKVFLSFPSSCKSPGPYGPDISPLQLEVVLESDTILHFKISDPNSRRWEVPLVVDSEAQRERLETPTKESLFEVSLTKSPFGISVTRRPSGIVVFNTTLGGFVFEDQFLQISTKLPNDAQIYGIGEHVEPLRQSTNYSYQTGFARDQFTTVGGTNLYGSHPCESFVNSHFSLSPSGRRRKCSRSLSFEFKRVGYHPPTQRDHL